MNWEQQLEVQAWLDGELSASDAGRVAAFVDATPEARVLVEELRMTKAFVAPNEPEFKLTETPEFYWSQIRRQIEAADRTGGDKAADYSEPVFTWTAVWRRITTPLSGLALVAILAAGSFSFLRNPALESLSSSELVEVEDLSEDIGSISYKSQAENMFVVYVYSKNSPDESSEEAAENFGDDFFQ